MTQLIKTILLLGLIALCQSQKFPKNFQWGAATSAYQIEGAYNEDGKGSSIWDYMTHILGGDTGDVTCDSYHKYREDVAMLKLLGVNYYRFSLSWSRLLPNGFSNRINQAGVNYYNNLIDMLLANGIKPAVTLYHWDYPINFKILGAFNNGLIIQKMVDYARIAFQLFGDRVKFWVTVNEPKVFCSDFTNALAGFYPYYPLGIMEYLCSHNTIKAHAAVYHLYDTEFRATQKGKVGIVLNFEWSQPKDRSESNLEAAERTRQFEFGWYANPIILGDYPAVMKQRIAERSRLENFAESRLPQFTSMELLQIKGTYDFLGINHYSTFVVQAESETPIGLPRYESDISTNKYQLDTWEGSALSYMKIVPWGMREMLNWIKETYNNPEVWITECGYPDEGGLQDDKRIEYYKGYLENLQKAIVEDGVNVKGFFAWSLMDNLEWGSGFAVKFGLYSVDFQNPNRTRTPKKSAAFYKLVVEKNALPGSFANSIYLNYLYTIFYSLFVTVMKLLSVVT